MDKIFEDVVDFDEIENDVDSDDIESDIDIDEIFFISSILRSIGEDLYSFPCSCWYSEAFTCTIANKVSSLSVLCAQQIYFNMATVSKHAFRFKPSHTWNGDNFVVCSSPSTDWNVSRNNMVKWCKLDLPVRITNFIFCPSALDLKKEEVENFTWTKEFPELLD